MTDYGDENPLLMDYFGFQKELYELKFKSHGDTALSERIVAAYTEVGPYIRTTTNFADYVLGKSQSEENSQVREPWRRWARFLRYWFQHNLRDCILIFTGPGLDHGVFVPFRIMFGHEFMDVPIVQVSIDTSMSPEKNWQAGKAVSKLR